MVTLFKQIVNRDFFYEKLQNLLIPIDNNKTSGKRLGIITYAFFAESSTGNKMFC